MSGKGDEVERKEREEEGEKREGVSEKRRWRGRGNSYLG